MIAKLVPWWAKIALKLIMSRLPVNPYTFWRRLGMFRHGNMDSPNYIISNIKGLFDFAGLSANTCLGKKMVELGPGDSIGTAVVAASYGVQPILVDVDHFATKDLQVYRNLISQLDISQPLLSDLNEVDSFQKLLSACDAEYLTNGIDSLATIADHSVNITISQACLEHVRKNEFNTLVSELYRVSGDGSIHIHEIDFKDHLSYGLNNLRFSGELWESQFMSSSGFYTNRLRYSDIKSAFLSAGFKVVKEETHSWDSLPLSKSKLHSDFHDYDESDLLIREAKIVLRK